MSGKNPCTRAKGLDAVAMKRAQAQELPDPQIFIKVLTELLPLWYGLNHD